MAILYMFMFFYYDFFKKLTGFVQNRAVDSALKKYPGLYLFSKKKKKTTKIKNENFNMILKWFYEFHP